MAIPHEQGSASLLDSLRRAIIMDVTSKSPLANNIDILRAF
jgi:hypothetical protein